MKQKLERLQQIGWIAHFLRSFARFGNRQGSQFAAAATYFSVLALVPVLMLAFSGLGLTLSLNPDLLKAVQGRIEASLHGTSMQSKIGDLVSTWITSWPGIGAFGLISALYAGAGWVSNLKAAVRAQWRPDFEVGAKTNFFKELGMNLLILFGLLIVGGLALAAAQLGTSLNDQIRKLLHLDLLPGSGMLAWFFSLLIATAAAWILFVFLYRVLPEKPTQLRPWLTGALWASVWLALLLQLTGLLIKVFAKNQAAALFGPVIVIMLMFNLFCQITLFFAAWIATWNQPAVARQYNVADEPLRQYHNLDAVDGHWESADLDRKKQQSEPDQSRPTSDQADRG